MIGTGGRLKLRLGVADCIVPAQSKFGQATRVAVGQTLSARRAIYGARGLTLYFMSASIPIGRRRPVLQRGLTYYFILKYNPIKVIDIFQE